MPTVKAKLAISGVTVAASADETAVVRVATWKVHRVFKKRYRTHRRYLAHNPGNLAQVGEIVVLTPCRPISKRKHWKIIKDGQVSVAATLPATKPVKRVSGKTPASASPRQSPKGKN